MKPSELLARLDDQMVYLMSNVYGADYDELMAAITHLEARSEKLEKVVECAIVVDSFLEECADAMKIGVADENLHQAIRQFKALTSLEEEQPK